MLIPIAIHHDPGSAYGVTVPDIPGAFSAGDTLEEALANAKEAIGFHIESLIEDGLFEGIVPAPLEHWQKDPDFTDAVWALVEMDMSRFSRKQIRFNVSWPEYLLSEVDACAAAANDTRSGFLAKAARAAIERSS